MIMLGLLLGMVGTDVNTGHVALHLRHSGTGRRHRLRRRRHGPVRLRARSSPTSRTASKREVVHGEGQGPVADAGGLAALPGRRCCAAPASARCSASCPAAARCWRSFAAYALEKKVAKDPIAVRQGRDRRRRRAGVGQQRRRADLVHSPAHARHPVQRGDGADGRRDDDPRHPARAAGDDRAAGAVLGHDRLHVGRQPDAGGPEPAADRHLDQAADGALPPPLSRRSCCSAASASTASTTARSTSS